MHHLILTILLFLCVQWRPIISFRIHYLRSRYHAVHPTSTSLHATTNKGKSSPAAPSRPKKVEEEEAWDELDTGADWGIDLDSAEEETLGPQKGDFKSGFVSILGNPNVGKSTLINALLNETLCIVSPKPQTTRHRILGVLTDKNYQLVFSDTPGMIEPAYKLQEAMMDSVRGAVGDADVILLVSDVYGEPLVDKTIMEKLTVTSRPILVVVNKVDLISGDTAGIIEEAAAGTASAYAVADAAFESAAAANAIEVVKQRDAASATATMESKLSFKRKLLLRRSTSASKSGDSDPALAASSSPAGGDGEGDGNTGAEDSNAKEKVEKVPKIKTVAELSALWAKRLPRAEVVPISATSRLGIDHVLTRLLAHMQQGPKYFTQDTLTNRDERFFTGEIIREAVFHIYKDEVPYSCEVVIDSFKDKTPTLSVIEACIVVSKDSQKAILIGRGGLKLKELGIAARAKLESFLTRKVFLSLHVRVDEDWRASSDSLAKYGYVESDFG